MRLDWDVRAFLRDCEGRVCVFAIGRKRIRDSETEGHRDCEGEAAETYVWLDFSLKCQYIEQNTHDELQQKYNNIIGKQVNMSLKPEK